MASTIGDYIYTITDSTNNYVSAKVSDTTKSSYSIIPSTININGTTYTLKIMDECYKDCTNLKGTVHIPSTVTSVTNIFTGTNTNKKIYVIPHSTTIKTALTTAIASLSNVQMIDEPAIDVYHYSSNSLDTVTFGGYDEDTSINKIVSYLNIIGEGEVYISETDELNSAIEDLGWYDIKQDWEPEEYFYIEPINIGTNMNVTFQEVMTSGANKANFPTYITPTFEYSYDKSTWNTYTVGNNLSINQKVYFRGDNLVQWWDSYSENSNYHTIYLNFTCNNKVKSGGNIMSLRYKNFNGVITLPSSHTFHGLFQNNTNLVTSPTLPATNLKSYCYQQMFDGCTSLQNAPILPTTTLAVQCYSNMFKNCTSLVFGPELPATTLPNDCYNAMFSGCTSLKKAPKLPATTLTTSCYGNMFKDCTSLLRAPNLPAMNLGNSCYSYMFSGCTSLEIAPVLPATNLTANCYQSMFQDCTSLIVNPELPATTLTDYCYDAMFYRCTSLILGPELPATNLANYCYRNMFYNCTSLLDAPKLLATTLRTYCYAGMFQGCSNLFTPPTLSATSLASYCYYNMFRDCTSLTTTPDLPATTLYSSCYRQMFYGCTSLTTTPALPATTLTDYCYERMFYGCTSLTTISKLPATTLSNYCYQQMFANNAVKAERKSLSPCTYQYRIPTSGTGTTATNSLQNMFSGNYPTPTINTTFYISAQSFDPT